METEQTYISVVSGDYISFTCGKCEIGSRLVKICPDEPNPSTDLKNITILGFSTKCPKCGDEGFFKLNLLGVEVKGVEVFSLE